jgi:hypothetical protein
VAFAAGLSAAACRLFFAALEAVLAKTRAANLFVACTGRLVEVLGRLRATTRLVVLARDGFALSLRRGAFVLLLDRVFVRVLIFAFVLLRGLLDFFIRCLSPKLSCRAFRL